MNTNECGLYETVDGNFLVNAGSGNFTPGMKVNVATLPITLYQLKLAKKPVIQEPKYITLEYIGLTGTQFIDTGYYPNNNTRFVAKIYLEERQSDFTTAIFGGRTSANSSRFTDSFSLWIDGIFDVGFIYQHGTLTASKLYVPVYGDVNIDANKNRVTLNNQASVATIEQTFTSTETLRIASNYTTDRNYTDGSGNDTRRFEGKIYSASIYDNEILVRDFIPAKRISDSKIGLYDRTNDTFYENAGTGNFEAGPETGTI